MKKLLILSIFLAILSWCSTQNISKTDCEKVIWESWFVYYESNSLGISFCYRPYEKWNPIISESGNKIFFNDYFLELMDKDPSMTLKEFISTQIITSWLDTKCSITCQEQTNQCYILWEIQDYTDKDWLWTYHWICPEKYLSTFIVRHFQSIPNHPEKMLFFNYWCESRVQME